MKRTEKYQRLSDISSTNARKALIRAGSDNGIIPKDVGPDRGQIKPQVIEWLESEGLVRCTLNQKRHRNPKRRVMWRTTELGQRLVSQHRPVFLRRSYRDTNYTSSPAMALSDAGEVLDWSEAA